MFKSNYAANQKRYHISYINTFKDIFLIILFFRQYIRRNLINTLRETWERHANVQGALARGSAAGEGAMPASPATMSRCHRGRECLWPFSGVVKPRQNPSRKELAQTGEHRSNPPVSAQMTSQEGAGSPLLPFIQSFIQYTTFNTYCAPALSSRRATGITQGLVTAHQGPTSGLQIQTWLDGDPTATSSDRAAEAVGQRKP